jgi:hypothetical protein
MSNRYLSVSLRLVDGCSLVPADGEKPARRKRILKTKSRAPDI